MLYRADQLKPVAVKGRYSHIAGIVLNDTLLISGGYCGSVVGDLWSLKLPRSVTAAHSVSPQLSLTSHHSALLLFFVV